MLNPFTTLITTLALGLATLALAADGPAPTKEAREKMAQAHEKMAACLRSDRELADCRSDMMKSCKETMGEKGCGKGMGMMGEHKHSQDKASAPSSSKTP